MLDSLHIKNYRNLKEFKIDSIDQINLITGKNNTGKSTILEAIAIYASRADISQLYQLLNNRGEDFSVKTAYSKQNDSKDIIDSNIRTLSSMFTDRKIDFSNVDNSISIGQIDKNFNKSITLRFVKYFDDIQKDEQGSVIQRRRILVDNNQEESKDSKAGFEIRFKNEIILIPLERDRPYRIGVGNFNDSEKFQFIRTANIDRDTNGKLFDNIALSEKEKYIIEALKIIEPTTERIAFIEESSRERIAVIKLSHTSEVLPLRSMGDGINRILTIILALVNSENGFLLLDEFENGLHYSVQEQLWKIIFELSKKLNVQVFATTHSNDCISGFEKVLNDSENNVRGKLIRLDNIDGVIKQVEFSPKEMEIASDQNIEMR